VTAEQRFWKYVDGFIVGARVVPREPDHEREKDDRLDYHEEQWVEEEARRLERESHSQAGPGQ
jgi:hypothetical protein